MVLELLIGRLGEHSPEVGGRQLYGLETAAKVALARSSRVAVQCLAGVQQQSIQVTTGSFLGPGAEMILSSNSEWGPAACRHPQAKFQRQRSVTQERSLFKSIPILE